MAGQAPETLERTNLGALGAGSRVNLERPLAPGDRLSGHFVQGHVDAAGELLALDPLPDELDFHQMGALPDGRGVVFVTHRESGMDTLAIFTGSERKTVLQLPGQDLSFPAYSPTGHILFWRRPLSEGLWAVRFSLASLETTGPPFPVTAKGSFPSVAADGTLVYLVAPPDTRDPARLGQPGGRGSRPHR